MEIDWIFAWLGFGIDLIFVWRLIGYLYDGDKMDVCMMGIDWMFVWWPRDWLDICMIGIDGMFVWWGLIGYLYDRDWLDICMMEIDWIFVWLGLIWYLYDGNWLDICMMEIDWIFVWWRLIGYLYDWDWLDICMMEIDWIFVEKMIRRRRCPVITVSCQERTPWISTSMWDREIPRGGNPVLMWCASSPSTPACSTNILVSRLDQKPVLIRHYFVFK